MYLNNEEIRQCIEAVAILVWALYNLVPMVVSRIKAKRRAKHNNCPAVRQERFEAIAREIEDF